MVGRLERGGVLWALLRDPAGGIHRVKQGNYIGQDHGRVAEIGSSYIAVVEIVTGTPDGWVEGPRQLSWQRSRGGSLGGLSDEIKHCR